VKKIFYIFLPLSLLASSPDQINKIEFELEAKPKEFKEGRSNLAISSKTTPKLNSFAWDHHYSPYAGAENLLFAQRIAETVVKQFQDQSDASIGFSLRNFIRRASEQAFIWLPLNYASMTTQHEVFGHGYRVREMGCGVAKVTKYHVRIPPPYAGGGGYTEFLFRPENYTLLNDIVASFGGIEATSIQASYTKEKWIERGIIDPREFFLYFFSHLHLPNSAFSMEYTNRIDAGQDISSYLYSLNLLYTREEYRREQLEDVSLLNYLDPCLYLSAYGWVRHLLIGEEFEIPAFVSIGKANVIPGFKAGLTPFGPESFLELFIKLNSATHFIYLREGSHPENSMTGFGYHCKNIWNYKSLNLGLRLDFWSQPKLITKPIKGVPFYEIERYSLNRPAYPYSIQDKRCLGLLGSCLVSLVTPSEALLELELGYKTEGYVPGQILKEGLVLRLHTGLAF
jgi:hypothetical protein